MSATFQVLNSIQGQEWHRELLSMWYLVPSSIFSFFFYQKTKYINISREEDRCQKAPNKRLCTPHIQAIEHKKQLKRGGAELPALPKKKKAFSTISFKRWKGVSIPSKALLLRSLHIHQKMTCRNIHPTLCFFLTFLPNKPSHARRWLLTELGATQQIPKRLIASSQRALDTLQWSNKWSTDSDSPLHI